MSRLLAKSYDQKRFRASPPDYALLTQHTQDVVSGCDELALAEGHIALENADIGNIDFDFFRLTLRANGWIQDIGKANSHFQEMVAGDPSLKQLLRHETISGLLVWLDQRYKNWLAPLGNELIVALWAAMGHHRKFDERTRPEIGVPESRILLTHPDFRAILSMMADDLQLDDSSIDSLVRNDGVIVPTQRNAEILVATESLDQLIEDFEDCEEDFADDSRRRFLALVKAFGIAADVLASALGERFVSKGAYSVGEFIDESLVRTGLHPADITRLIHKWAWKHATECDRSEYDLTILPPGFQQRTFQTGVERSESFLTFAAAGCGSGKSLAAYLWARRWSENRASLGRENFRLFICLPTTGTATEHFKDYALESGIDDITLTHSRSTVDLKAITESASGEDSDVSDSTQADAARSALNAERDKIESLRLWSTPLVVSTTDTVLGLMANARRPMYSFPAIMNSAIVFDEIHAFDDQLFGHLLVFLKNFPKMPVLLMTASLPEQRRRAIEAVRPDVNVVAGPKDYEELDRYIIDTEVNEGGTWEMIESCIRDSGKVLWVRNRVDWANEAYENCRERFNGENVFIDVYHSRLRYRDRSRRHRRVVDRFKIDNEPAILVATQVAEMSLDLSADLLISDIAPIPALIQRLGRLNRRSTPDNERAPKPCVIRPMNDIGRDAAPYDKDEISVTQRWIDKLHKLDKALSQRDLAEAFVDFEGTTEFDIRQAEERAWFFGVPGKSGLWRTRPGLTRDEGYTVSIILESDLKSCTEFTRRGDPKRDWIREHEVAIPYKHSVLRWQRVGALRIAPEEEVHYDYDPKTHEGTGASWITQ